MLRARHEGRAVTPLSDAHVDANKRQAALVAAGLAAAVTVALWLPSLLLGRPAVTLLVAVLVASAATAAVFALSERLVVAMVGARPADPVEHARLHNLVEGLCFAAGLPKPSVHVVEDKAVNAFAAGRSPRHAVVGVTTGLLAVLTRVELEAVLAHELSRLKSWDVLPATLVATMVGLPASLLPRPAMQRLVAWALGSEEQARWKETAADLGSVAVTRYPPGLISAMEKLRDDTATVRSGTGATAHLWTDPPGTAPAGRRDGLDERIEALREL